MLKNKLGVMVCFIFLLGIVNCEDNYSGSEDKNTKDLYVREKGACIFTNYSNIIFEMKDGPSINVPIYGGRSGTTSESKLAKNLTDPQISILGNLCYELKRGKAKLEMMNLIEYYSESLLKNANKYKPTVIGREGPQWIIWYDFDYLDQLGTLMIVVPVDLQKPIDRKYLTNGRVSDIRGIFLNESSGIMNVHIDFGKRSPFFKDNK